MQRVFWLMAILMVTITGCGVDWFPLTNPNAPATITLSASSLSPGVGGSVTITATVKNASGAAVADGTVVSFVITSGSGSFTTTSTPSTTGGTATVTLTSNIQGTVTVSASSGTATPGTITVTFGSLFSVSATPQQISATALLNNAVTSNITAKIVDTSGNPVIGAVVNFTTTGGSLSLPSAMTDPTGVATTVLTVPVGTTSGNSFTITATQATNTANTGSVIVSIIP